MQDSVTGFFIVGLIILLFTLGSGSLLIDSFLNKSMDTFPPNLESENPRDKAFANYTAKFLEDY